MTTTIIYIPQFTFAKNDLEALTAGIINGKVRGDDNEDPLITAVMNVHENGDCAYLDMMPQLAFQLVEHVTDAKASYEDIANVVDWCGAYFMHLIEFMVSEQ